MTKSCKECPYSVKSKHNINFPNYVDVMYNSGNIKSRVHTCHMKGNVWSEPTQKTVCAGSLKRDLEYESTRKNF